MLSKTSIGNEIVITAEMAKSTMRYRNGMLGAIAVPYPTALPGIKPMIRVQPEFQVRAGKVLNMFVSAFSTLVCRLRAKTLLDEKQLVNVFLKVMIDTPSFTCADMNKVFFDGCEGTSLMQIIFNQLPGMQFSDQITNNPPLYENTNPGFVGLEQSINGVKGYVGPFPLLGRV